jgi:transcriptional regulator with GAF, ATPase, and Fis domain
MSGEPRDTGNDVSTGPRAPAADALAALVGQSEAIAGVRRLIGGASNSDVTVLIGGESGTGKELVANAVHYSSPRASGPFIKLNCAALPESMIESELFGHEKGSFTGAAAQHEGRFERADKGTIFLDEVGDFSHGAQTKLLRVLQQREFERVGGNETIKVDVRVIAASNRDLKELVAQGEFRGDLFYRLNVFPIQVPPLRERGTDICLLADHFVNKYTTKYHKTIARISSAAMALLVDYQWPGNVRELENWIERAVVLGTDDVIDVCHLPPDIQTCAADPDFGLRAAIDVVGDVVYAALLAGQRPGTGMAKGDEEEGPVAQVAVRGMALGLERYLTEWRTQDPMTLEEARVLFGFAPRPSGHQSLVMRALHEALREVVNEARPTKPSI